MKKIKDDYFKFINTPNKAYYLGFIMADGCIYNSRVFSIEIQSRDAYLIEKLRDLVYPQKKLYKRKRNKNWSETTTFTFSNKRFCDWLKLHGVIERKAGRLKFPEINPVLLPHFLRGYFDGDGGFRVKSTDKKPKLEITSICKGFLKSYQEVLEKEYGILSHIYSRKRKGNRKISHTLEIFARDDLQKVYGLFYSHRGTFCKRKQKTFEHWNKL